MASQMSFSEMMDMVTQTTTPERAAESSSRPQKTQFSGKMKAMPKSATKTVRRLGKKVEKASRKPKALASRLQRRLRRYQTTLLGQRKTTGVRASRDDPGSTLPSFLATNTSIEVCHWTKSFEIEHDMTWVRAEAAHGGTHPDVLRVASCLNRANKHLYDLPNDIKASYPPGAAGYKEHYHHEGPRRNHPRGAKGLKRPADADYPRCIASPNEPRNGRRFFPKPSPLRNVRLVEGASKPRFVKLGSRALRSTRGIVSRTLGGSQSQRTMDWVSTLGDAVEDNKGIEPEVPHGRFVRRSQRCLDMRSLFGDEEGKEEGENSVSEQRNPVHALEASSSDCGLSDLQASGDGDADSVSIYSDYTSSSGHTSNTSTSFHHDEGHVKLRPQTAEQLFDLRAALEDECDHDVYHERLPRVRPTLPEGVEYASRRIGRGPHLIVAKEGARFDPEVAEGVGDGERPRDFGLFYFSPLY